MFYCGESVNCDIIKNKAVAENFFATDEEKYNEAERWIPLLQSFLPKNREFEIYDLYDKLPFEPSEINKLQQVDLELTALLVKTGKFKYSRVNSIYHIEATGPFVPSIINNEISGLTRITPELKDAVLLYLCNTLQPERHFHINPKVMADFLEINYSTLSAILSQFERLGLIGDLSNHPRQISLTLMNALPNEDPDSKMLNR